jgi:tight adherence protein B
VKTREPNLGAIASTVQRLAVLLAAGVAPAAAWEYLRDGELQTAVAAACRGGASIPDAIAAASEVHSVARERVAWCGLATAWAVATDVGAPLAPTLREFSASLRDLAQAQREIAVALAAPTATARLVLALPPVGILFGVLLGFDTLGTLFTTPPGWVCLTIGSGLMFAASRWNGRLVAQAQPRDLTPGLGFDLLAIAVSGGGSLDRACATVAAATARFTLDDGGTDPGIAETLELSTRAGVPAAELLRSGATERRRDALALVQSRAQALSVRLMIPLGVCVLPAFLVLSVVPLLLAVLAQTRVLH